MIERIINDLKVKDDELQAFEVEDPFNTQHVLKGFVSKKSDYRYGALAITHINSQEAYQIIFGTPKQHYPFGKDGKFRFPEAREIEVYEKLDGTNVLAYSYLNGGQEFQTYKLRLFPVLRKSKFGDFLEMWKELLERYPQIKNITETNKCNVSFEMYGSRNIHLMLYDNPLETALLFGVDNQARIISPSKLDTLSVPTAKLLSKITSKQELVGEYNRFREDIERKNVKNEDEKIKGLEGVVWYLLDTKEIITQFKCKPESIEQIHWESSVIDINTIEATAHNVFETADKLTYEATVELLKEEFTEEQISKSEDRVKSVVARLLEWYEFQRKVTEVYKQIGININDNKQRVMRELSKHFPKNLMGRVYTAVTQLGK